MPRLTQSEIHSNFSTGSATWVDYRTGVIALYDNYPHGELNDHITREFNKKIRDLGQAESLYISAHNAGLRYIGDGVFTVRTTQQDEDGNPAGVVSYALSSFPSYGVIPDDWQEDENILGVTIGGGITSIGNNAFDGCEDMVGDLVIPNSVTSIGTSAFEDCEELNGTLTLNEGLLTIGDDAFNDCEELTGHITIPNSVTSIGEECFRGCEEITGLTIGSGLTSIPNKAFLLCSGLTSITIPDGVTSIGQSAFGQCTSLTSVTIPDSVTSIEAGAFSNCTSLTSITFGSGLTSIGVSAFDNCNSLTSITIPDGVTSVGGTAFIFCSSLTSITIGSGVTDFSYGYQFYGCPATTITCHLTASFFISTNALAASSVTAMTVDSGKGWTAGSQTVAGKTGVTVTIA